MWINSSGFVFDWLVFSAGIFTDDSAVLDGPLGVAGLDVGVLQYTCFTINIILWDMNSW